MTIQQAKSIGGKQLLKAAAFLFLLFEILMLYIETRGDFANGILFFLDAQANIYFILFSLTYFGLMFFLGRQAAVFIIIKNTKHYIIAGLFAASTTLLLAVAIAIVAFLIDSQSVYENLNNYDTKHALLQNSFIFFILICVVWLWATNRIQRERKVL